MNNKKREEEWFTKKTDQMKLSRDAQDFLQKCLNKEWTTPELCEHKWIIDNAPEHKINEEDKKDIVKHLN